MGRLFVEHEGTSEAFVRDQISASLAELQTSREIDLGASHLVVAGATCADRPTCALVMCTYTAEPWPAA